MELVTPVPCGMGQTPLSLLTLNSEHCMVDPIADMLTRIRNAYLAGRGTVAIPHSTVKEAIVKILCQEGFLATMEVTKEEKSPQPIITASLVYRRKIPLMEGIQRVSTPGRRMYARSKKIPKTLGGFGTTIVSTNQGIMTAKEARKHNLGGEVLLKVW